MSWTSPRTWVASEVVTASIMNTHVRDNLLYLKDAPAFTGDVSVAATKKIYLDGGGDTYLTEASANSVWLTVGGTTSFSAAAAYCYIPSTNKFYFDGGGDTYITESSANNLRCVAGGSGGVELTSGATSWSAVSDERLKELLGTITDATAKVEQLRAVIGRYRDDRDATRRPMLIAQDVQRVLPEAVTEGADGYLRLAYTEVIPLLVAAIQELSQRVAALESKG